MSLASIFWYWVPCDGSQTYSRKGLQITRTGHRCLCRWNCKYQLTSDKLKLLFVAGWDGILPCPGCRTVRGGENTEDRFRSISTLTRCTNTNLFKDEEFIPFYVDSWSHLKTSPATFTSKHHTWSVIFSGHYLVK